MYATMIAYGELLGRAGRELGIRTVHILSDVERPPGDWTGRSGFIDERVIREEVRDYSRRTFYVSGPPLMVKNCRKSVHRLGVKRSRIRTDYFPCLA